MPARRLASVAALLVACKGAAPEPPAPAPPPPDASTPADALTPADGLKPADALTPADASPPPEASPRGPPSTSAISAPDPPDGSALDCRVLRGPIELPIRAPPALGFRGDVMEAVFNDNGLPRTIALQAGPVTLAPVPAGRERADGDKALGLAIPCAVAADQIFCPDRSGAIHRSTRGAAEDRVVASSRVATRIAAAPIGGAHTALAYLASRQTSEGWVSEAWLALDDAPPLRVSDDGSGATGVALGQRGGAILALMIDARTALTAMHARTISYGNPPRLGEDSVVFVGGPGDRRTRAAFSVAASGPSWAFLPIAKDVGSFGLAIVRIDDPPGVDEPVVWSMYPNGLDPAPIAAATSGAGSPVTWVARVRPRSSEPSSPRVLELGRLVGAGVFATRGVLPTTGNPTDVGLAVDPFGALWLAWLDGGGSWIERLFCR